MWVTAMTTDERDILELLKDELDFIEKGGYGRSVRTPWQNKSAFQDSLSCINYGFPNRAHPCTECHLLEFVSPGHSTEQVPCHFIPLNAGRNHRGFGATGQPGEARARSKPMASRQDQAN